MSGFRKRRRLPCEESISPSSGVNHDSETWLEWLPSDVRERIVRYVSRGNPSASALFLAESGTRMRNAVRRVMRQFDARDVKEGLVARWVVMVMPTVLQTTLARTEDHRFAVFNYELLYAPKLRSLHVQAEDFFYFDLPKMSSLEEIVVYMTFKVTPRILCNTFSKFNLKSISYICGGMADCPFVDPEHCTAIIRSTRSACPRLESLSIHCGCSCVTKDQSVLQLDALRELSSTDEAMHPMFSEIKNMLNLKRVFFLGEYPQSALTRLVEIGNVRIRQNSVGSQFSAVALGCALRSIRISDALSAEQIMMLSKCPNLEDLFLKVVDGNETALLNIIDKLPVLARLSLYWQQPEEDDEDNDQLYFNSNPNVILDIVKACPRLRELHLQNVLVHIDELRAILASMGNRLESFMASFRDDELGSDFRLASILEAAVLYNPELRAFKVIENDSDIEDEEVLDPKEQLFDLGDDHAIVESFDSDNVERLLRRLLRNSPKLDVSSFRGLRRTREEWAVQD